MEISHEDKETLESLEQELWRAETLLNKPRMSEIIAEDFFEFGKTGQFYERQDLLSATFQPTDSVPPKPEFHVRLLSETIAQITYDSSSTQNGIVEHARRCSLWSRTDNSWVLRYHQGTPFQP
jgi:hypothetical protein